MKKNIFSYICFYFRIALIPFFLFIQNTVFSQNDTIKPNADTVNLIQVKGRANLYNLIIQFNKDTITFNKGEIISNVLYVKNEGSKNYNFNVQLILPNEWIPVGLQSKTFSLEAGKEIFIPVNIIPRLKVSGNAQVLITAFIQNNENPDEVLGSTYFQSIYNKRTAWKVSSDVSKIYLKNGQDSVSFSLNASNLGNTNQDLIINVKKNKSNIKVLDSLKNEPFEMKTITLKSQQDTTFHLRFIREKEHRNERLIDIDNYRPTSNGQPEKYTLNISSQSPRPDEKNTYQSGAKLDVIKLNDAIDANIYNNNRLPLIMEINTYNLLGAIPAMNVWLYGNASLENNQNLVYNFQSYFFQNFLSNNFLKQSNFFIYYSNDKMAAQIGNAGVYTLGAFPGSFGARGEYKFNPEHKAGVFYTQNPQIWFPPTAQTAGMYYQYNKKNKINVSSQYAHSRSLVSNLSADIINVRSSFSVFKNHSFGINGGISRRVKNDTAKIGYFIGTNYSGHYGKKWYLQISNFYINPLFGIVKQERFYNLLSLSRQMKNSRIYLRSSLYLYKIIQSQNYFDYQMINELFHQFNNTKIGNISYSVFYNLFYIKKFTVHSRGLGLNTSTYNIDKFLRYYFYLKAGYNYSPDTLRKNFFFAQIGSQLFYKTISFNIRYTYGNLGVDERFYVINNTTIPQFFSVFGRHQYQFKIRNLVMENYAGYSISTINYSTLYWQPNIYFYSKNGWRFRAYSEMNLNKQKRNDFASTPALQNLSSTNQQWTFYFFFGFGVRKEFSFPMPYSKKYYENVVFIPFFDLNGDGKKQDNEKALENVVIRVFSEQKNEYYEMLTNNKGMATLKNIEVGTYNWNVWALDDLGGWFPHISDSLNIATSGVNYIPFVRGVKIVGKVYLQRDKNSPDANQKLDLSRIKITCQNSKTYTTITDNDGNFEIFVPAGKYTITMDEKILGSKFKLLQNNIELQVDDKYSNIFIPFHIIEKTKKIKLVKPE